MTNIDYEFHKNTFTMIQQKVGNNKPSRISGRPQ